MPKEHKKRGRREQEKRKPQQLEEAGSEGFQESEPPGKKQKRDPEYEDNEDFVGIVTEPSKTSFNINDLPDQATAATVGDEEAYTADNGISGTVDTPFYGLLDEDEQAMFKEIDHTLQSGGSSQWEDRNAFIEMVHEKTIGKELKMACSQSCSRTLERLIQTSSSVQLKNLFSAFQGHFLHLVQHRFASHCCETLFRHAALMVTGETLQNGVITDSSDLETAKSSMEEYFLKAVEEFKPYLGFLISDTFGSHGLRTLLLVLSGWPLVEGSSTKMLSLRKKKSIDPSNSALRQFSEHRVVPQAFEQALDDLLAGTVAGLDTTYLRVMAMQEIASPVMQLLIQLEFVRDGKQKAKDINSIYRKLLPDESFKDTSNTAFLRGLLYDSVGSRLFETIIEHCPGKAFKQIYDSVLKPELARLAKGSSTGYVVMKGLERVSKEELREAIDIIAPEFPVLIERNRLSVVKTLVERAYARDIDTKTIIAALETAYGVSGSGMLEKMLRYNESHMLDGNSALRQHLTGSSSPAYHGSLLAQSMLIKPGLARESIFNALINTSTDDLALIARHISASHVLQLALKLEESETRITRKQLVTLLLPRTAQLAIDPVASHVVDAIWKATNDLQFLRDRVATELEKSEPVIRQSEYGYCVWRTWKMDLYKGQRYAWLQQMDKAKKDEEQKRGGSERDYNRQTSPKKSKLEVAREKYASRKVKKPDRANHDHMGSKGIVAQL